ncbi:MAG: rhomboid family intramembrane serine protease [Thermomicrobiales bacterium]
MTGLFVMILMSLVLILAVNAADSSSARYGGARASSAALVAVVGIPSLVGLAMPSFYDAAKEVPEQIGRHGEWWRLVTATVVQDSRAGAAFNIVALALVAYAATGVLGWRITWLTFWLCGILGNALAWAFDVETAGSSGATFALAGGIAIATLIAGRRGGFVTGRRASLAAAGCLIGSAVLWLGGNVHGMATAEGAVLVSAFELLA